MKKRVACLLMLSALLSGCASSKFTMKDQSNMLPQDFIYPVTDNTFLNDVIARHKVDSKKDLMALFTVPVPPSVNLCGLSEELIRSHVLIDEAASEKISKKSAKAFLREGIEGTFKMASDSRNFSILESTCPAPGSRGSVTTRSSINQESNIAGKTSKVHMVSVTILSFGQDLQPTLRTDVIRRDGSDLPPTLSYAAVGDKYTTGKNIQLVSFSNIQDKNNITLIDTANNGVTTTSLWSDGQLASIFHMKGGKMHGEIVIFAQNVAGIDIPETRTCYKKGQVLKTTGACEVD